MFGSKGGKNIGIALSADAVELVEISKNQLTQHVRVPIEGAEDEPVIAALRQIASSLPAGTSGVAVSLPSQDILLRFFSLPLLPKSEWEAAIKFEARKHIPFRTDELVWDYHALEDRAHKQISVVFCRCAQRPV